MKYTLLASRELRSTIEMLEKAKDRGVDQIINNLKEEEDRLDTFIMNKEDKYETKGR